MDDFMQDPTTALIAVGATFKPGITFKFIETEAEKNSLPSNVIPLHKPKENQQLSIDELDNISGGTFDLGFGHGD
jgi:bacteriocin-like protein